MTPILIQGAENSEIEYLLGILKNKKEIEIRSFKFWKGKIANKNVVISRTKVGEINAAIATTIGIINFNPKCIINQGTAGGHDKNIHRGDIVIGKEYFPITNFKINYADEGQGSKIENWNLQSYHSDDDEKVTQNANFDLVKFVERLKDEYTYGNIYTGIIGSGDIWNREIDRIKFLNKEYGTLCEEMETAGVYQTANSFRIPVIGIRIISNNEILKEEYLPELSTECQKFVEKIITNLNKEG